MDGLCCTNTTGDATGLSWKLLTFTEYPAALKSLSRKVTWFDPTATGSISGRMCPS